MLITYYGHALFALETADGQTIVTDPYDASVGYPMGELAGDVVTISHEHHDHNNISLVKGRPVVLRGEGTFEPLLDVRITGLSAFHDDQGGSQRGKNTLFLIEADGLRIVHLGDLGHELSPSLLHALGRVDILMVPVGGYYTIDASQASHLCHALMPRIVIPMHYRTERNSKSPIAPVTEFLSALNVRPSPMPLIRVTKEDLSQQPSVALLDHRPLPVRFPNESVSIK